MIFFNSDRRKLDHIITLLEDLKLMTEAQATKIIERVAAATTKGSAAAKGIGVRLTALEAKIKSVGLSEEQENALLAQLEGAATNAEELAAALEPMANNPSDAVPVEPPPPLEPVGE